MKEPRRRGSSTPASVVCAGRRRCLMTGRAPPLVVCVPPTTFDMFNGAPDRYDWQEGRKVYIASNSYKIDDPKKLKVRRDHQRPGPHQPRTSRYELHRVWRGRDLKKASAISTPSVTSSSTKTPGRNGGAIDHYDGRGQL